MRRSHWIGALVVAAMATVHAQQPGRYDVARFGAVGDGKAIDTEAINSNIVASGVRDPQGILISGIPNYPIEDVRLSNIRIHYMGGGTTADAALDPQEKEKDYPEPTMFGRLPVYALFARHVTGFDVRDADFSFEKDEARPAVQLRDVVRVDMDNVRVQKPGTTARELLAPIHLAKAVKDTF